MKQEKNRNFHSKLKSKMDKYAFNAYKNTKKFPKDELFGIVSQLRKSALSVILNYIEGYARFGEKQYRNFLLMSFGSLKESKYLLFFSYREGCLEKEEYNKLLNLADEIGAMLWTTIQGIKRD